MRRSSVIRIPLMQQLQCWLQKLTNNFEQRYSLLKINKLLGPIKTGKSFRLLMLKVFFCLLHVDNGGLPSNTKNILLLPVTGPAA
jgi:hypothetical protein